MYVARYICHFVYLLARQKSTWSKYGCWDIGQFIYDLIELFQLFGEYFIVSFITVDCNL
jgi:hypothetical protein